MNILEINDDCRKNFNKYLEEIIACIPPKGNIRLLDIGCGSGVSTIQLALNTDYLITSVDIDDEALDYLQQKAASCLVSDQIRTMKGTFETVIDKQMTFDIVLAEGLFNIIGFDQGLSQTCKVLANDGYLILHDGLDMIESKKKAFESYGFSPLKTIEISISTWGELYCYCLAKKIHGLDQRQLSKNEQARLAQIKSDIELYAKSPQSFGSVYYLLQRNS